MLLYLYQTKAVRTNVYKEHHALIPIVINYLLFNLQYIESAVLFVSHSS